MATEAEDGLNLPPEPALRARRRLSAGQQGQQPEWEQQDAHYYDGTTHFGPIHFRDMADPKKLEKMLNQSLTSAEGIV